MSKTTLQCPYSNYIKNTVQRRSDQIKDLQFIRKDIY